MIKRDLLFFSLFKVHVLMAKDLMIIDPDDELVLATVCEFYDYGVNFEKEVSILKSITSIN